MATLSSTGPEEVVNILKSDVISLIPTDSESPFRLHEKLIACLSPPLHAACQGQWSESTSKAYRFEKSEDAFDHVTEQTLTCFSRYAYLGDYSTDDVGISSYVEEQVDFRKALGDESSLFVFPGTGIYCKRCRNKGAKFKGCGRCGAKIYKTSSFSWDVGDVDPEEPIPEIDETNDPESRDLVDGEGRAKDHSIASPESSQVLLLHVRGYVFADTYSILPLKNVSKHKIIAYLKQLEHSKDNHREAILDLLESAFSHLPDSDYFLAWLGRYASWKLKTLQQDSLRLECLIAENDGCFAKLLVKHVLPSPGNPFLLSS